MREVVQGVFLEDRYPGVILGAAAADGDVLLIDTPLRIEDGREWLGELGLRGRPRMVVLLDQHPDRVLGARGLDLAVIAHQATREAIAAWPDVYKPPMPMGAESDRLRRVAGIHRAVPHIAFTDTLTLMLGNTPVELWHRPGPTPGAIWVVLPAKRTIFVGDLVSLREPPYLGEADIDAWLESLHELRGAAFRKYRILSSRDGQVRGEAFSAMASFLRKVDGRLTRLQARGEPPEATAKLALQLARNYRVGSARKEAVAQRLRSGLATLYLRRYADSD
ncbi:MAG TPA: MBL fold metallo-hydrolase [Anaerolineales bacterium]|nr:MBL fold metallo-hydrolase [Anaerolineales bacterium]